MHRFVTVNTFALKNKQTNSMSVHKKDKFPGRANKFAFLFFCKNAFARARQG